MATDDENPEIDGLRLITCVDEDGNEINIGAGHRGASVTIIGPPAGTAVLTDAQAAEYQEILGEALMGAVLAG